MTETFLRLLLTQAAAGGALTLLVLAARKLLRGRVKNALLYAAWGVVALRLLMPLSMPNRLLPAQAIRPAPAASAQTQLIFGAGAAQPEQTMAAQATAPERTGREQTLLALPESAPAAGRPFPRGAALLALWALGAALTLAYTIAVNARFRRALRKRPLSQDRFACPIPLYLADIPSPCLVGALRPYVVLTPESLADGGRWALRHELTHYRRGDHLFGLVRSALCIVYWFSPLTWLAARASIADCELACDEAALRGLSRAERLCYGETLLALARAGRPRSALHATAMSSGKRTIMERMRLIVNKPQTSSRRALSALVSLALALALLCSFATAEAPVETAPADSLSATPTPMETTQPDSLSVTPTPMETTQPDSLSATLAPMETAPADSLSATLAPMPTTEASAQAASRETALFARIEQHFEDEQYLDAAHQAVDAAFGAQDGSDYTFIEQRAGVVMPRGGASIWYLRTPAAQGMLYRVMIGAQDGQLRRVQRVPTGEDVPRTLEQAQALLDAQGGLDAVRQATLIELANLVGRQTPDIWQTLNMPIFTLDPAAPPEGALYIDRIAVPELAGEDELPAADAGVLFTLVEGDDFSPPFQVFYSLTQKAVAGYGVFDWPGVYTEPVLPTPMPKATLDPDQTPVVMASSTPNPTIVPETTSDLAAFLTVATPAPSPHSAP